MKESFDIPFPEGMDGADGVLPEEWNRLVRYLTRDLSDPDRVEAEAWISADPVRQALVQHIRTVSLGPVETFDVDAAWVNAQRRVRHPHMSKETLRFQGTRRYSWRYLMAAGAAIVVSLVAAGHGLRSIPHDRGGHTYTTRTGQRVELTLSDGSRVVLAPQSSLTIEPTFGTSVRTVTLVGQARFVVTTQATAPFTVRTGAVVTRVLGTTFDVSRYRTDRAVRVEVLQGKIAVDGRRSLATMTAGHVGQFTDSTATVVSAEPASTEDWTHGRLAFNDAPVHVVLETLSRWYAYKFELADSSLANQKITAVFDVNAPEESLQMLKRVLRVSLTVQDSIVVLRADPAFNRKPVMRTNPALFPVPKEFGK